MTLLRLCTCGAKVRTPPCQECRQKSRTTTSHRKRQRPNWRLVYNTARWRKLRTSILDRDDHQCQRGLHGCSGVATTVGHVHPFHGPDDPLAWDEANLQAECAYCNSAEAGSRSR